MKNIASLSKNDRKALFRNTAGKLGLTEAVVEKDFWVSFALDYLFHRSPIKDSIVFKGGTSLSKGFGLISRFSEDIDITIDWRVLGYGKREPLEERSKSKQKEFNEGVRTGLEDYLRNTLCPAIKEGISKEIGSEADIHVSEQDKDEGTIIFAYPKLFEAAGILTEIRMEFGALSALSPSERKTIRPYVAEYYPNLFEQKDTDVRMISPIRTFWDKATILHQEANRPMDKRMPSRYSRHYYDLYCMAKTYVKDAALSNIALLEEVVKMKMRFYPSGWSKYEEAKPGTFKLVPPENRMEELKSDYKAMREMLYGDVPSLETIVSSLRELEEEINSLPH